LSGWVLRRVLRRGLRRVLFRGDPSATASGRWAPLG
jgi:hypothetical protein